VSQSLAVRAAPIAFLLLWSGGFTVAKLGIKDADPFTLLCLRYFAVVVLLLPFLIVIRPAWPQSRNEWLHIAWVGFLIQVVYFGTAWAAFELGGAASTVALITCLQPLLVALVMPKISRESVSRLGWVGLLLGLLGTTLVIFGNSGIQVVGIEIVLLCIVSLLAITTATVWEKRFGKSHHPLTTNSVQYAVGFACTLPIAFFFEEMHIEVTLSFLFAFAYLVIGNSILAISLLLYMIQKGQATQVSALFFLVPPVTAVIAWIVLGERMMPLAWVGMLIAAMGVWLVSRQSVSG